MKLIIAGSRDLKITVAQVEEAVEYLDRVDIVICGECKEPDIIGKLWAKKHKKTIWSLPAAWTAYHKGAGFDRNIAMAKIADEALLFWDGTSPGTKHMNETMMAYGKPVYIVEISYEAYAHPIKKVKQ